MIAIHLFTVVHNAWMRLYLCMYIFQNTVHLEQALNSFYQSELQQFLYWSELHSAFDLPFCIHKPQAQGLLMHTKQISSANNEQPIIISSNRFSGSVNSFFCAEIDWTSSLLVWRPICMQADRPPITAAYRMLSAHFRVLVYKARVHKNLAYTLFSRKTSEASKVKWQ